VKEIHPLTELIPERADQDAIEFLIAQNGFTDPVVIYEGKIIEGRVRYRAARRVSVQPQFRDWVLMADGDPLDWMVRKHVETHELNELDKTRLVAVVLPYYREMKGSTHKRLYEATRLPWNKIRVVDWLQEAGALEPVLKGDLGIYEAARKLGLAGDKRAKALGKSYGAGDKFDEATLPVKRYLAAWKRKGYEFRHVNPKEAQRRVSLIESLVEELQAAKTDLDKRAVTSSYSAPPERKKK
jgi:hypothetical protein